jgi:hypothetical protein
MARVVSPMREQLSTLAPRQPGGEGRVRGADEPVHAAAHLTFPPRSLSWGRASRGPGGDGPLPLPPEGRRGAFVATVAGLWHWSSARS